VKTEDIENIYELKLQAEQVQPFLRDSTYRFENYVDNFNHTEKNKCSTEGHYISESMLAYEANHFVDIIETHEMLFKDLKDAVDRLPECQSNRYIDGQRVRKEVLEDDLTDLIDQYRNDFDEVIRVCGKTAVEEDLPGPQKVRSKRNQRQAQRQAAKQRSTAEVLKSFFSD